MAKQIEVKVALDVAGKHSVTVCVDDVSGVGDSRAAGDARLALASWLEAYPLPSGVARQSGLSIVRTLDRAAAGLDSYRHRADKISADY